MLWLARMSIEKHTSVSSTFGAFERLHSIAALVANSHSTTLRTNVRSDFDVSARLRTREIPRLHDAVTIAEDPAATTAPENATPAANDDADSQAMEDLLQEELNDTDDDLLEEIQQAGADNAAAPLPDRESYLEEHLVQHVKVNILADVMDFVASIQNRDHVTSGIEASNESAATPNGDANGRWPNCHPSIRPEWLKTVAKIQHAAPDFDIGTLVAPSRGLNASTVEALHYPTNKCEERLQRFGEVKDRKNPSILSRIQKSADDKDTLYIDMVPLRLARNGIGDLGLTKTQLYYADLRPYDYLIENKKTLDILAKFWQ